VWSKAKTIKTEKIKNKQTKTSTISPISVQKAKQAQISESYHLKTKQTKENTHTRFTHCKKPFLTVMAPDQQYLRILPGR
jgi:hypothetical protein